MQALRAALGNGLHLENARAIIVACDNLLKNDDLSNPIVILAIRALVTHIADARSGGEPIDADSGDEEDRQLLNAVYQLLDFANKRQLGVLVALNRFSRIFAGSLVK